MYIGAKPTLVGNYDGFCTGIYGINQVSNFVADKQWKQYYGASQSSTTYAHAFAYPFTSTPSNVTININGENYDATGKLFDGDTTLGTVNLNTTHGATVNRTYIAQVKGNLTINGTVTVGTQVRGCIFAVDGNVSLTSGSIVATDYGADSYNPSSDWNIVRSDINSTHSVSSSAISGGSQIFVGNRGAAGFPGSAGSNGRCGGGGAGGVWNGNSSAARGSFGADGGIFAAGPGGGGSIDNSVPNPPVDFGGDGGDASTSYGGAYGVGGGAGNPLGTGQANGQDGAFGVGGNITIIATGNVSIDGSSSITSNGSHGGASMATSSSHFSCGGGASGGGSFIVFCGGSYTNSGTITLNGGTGGYDLNRTSTSPSGTRGGNGGNGGAGSSLTVASVTFEGAA